MFAGTGTTDPLAPDTSLVVPLAALLIAGAAVLLAGAFAIAMWRRKWLIADLPTSDARWANVDTIPDEELWECHQLLRRRLVEAAVQRGSGAGLDPEALTIGFSRRFAPYKRANLLLTDRARLAQLLHGSQRPVQFGSRARVSRSCGAIPRHIALTRQFCS